MVFTECPNCKSTDIAYIEQDFIVLTKEYLVKPDGKVSRKVNNTQVENANPKYFRRFICKDCDWRHWIKGH